MTKGTSEFGSGGVRKTSYLFNTEQTRMLAVAGLSGRESDTRVRVKTDGRLCESDFHDCNTILVIISL